MNGIISEIIIFSYVISPIVLHTKLFRSDTERQKSNPSIRRILKKKCLLPNLLAIRSNLFSFSLTVSSSFRLLLYLLPRLFLSQPPCSQFLEREVYQESSISPLATLYA